jgi:hypothetical protein
MANESKRRPSSRFNDRQSNVLFASIEGQLHAALIDNTENTSLDIGSVYVCERLTAHTPQSKAALLARMPQDVQAIASPTTGHYGSYVGVLELDLIAFLLHYKRNRLLSVVGSIGTGKTTFIRYVLEDVRRRCPSLNRYAPVVLNCLAIGSHSPSFVDLLFEVVRAAESWVRSEAALQQSLAKKASLTQIVDSFRDMRNAPDSRDVPAAYFIDFVRRLADCVAPDYEPVVVFDNVDQLEPEAVSRICTLARAVHVNTHLCVLTAMRPTTHRTQIERYFEKGALAQFSIEVEPPDLRAVIRQRLRKVFRDPESLRLVSANGISIAIGSAEAAISSLSEKVLNQRSQSIFLREICGNNVRKALVGFVNFLRFRDLKYQLLLGVKHDVGTTDEELHGSWFEHFLTGLMEGDRQFFMDGYGPISNILTFEHGGRDNYLVLYWTLAGLSWAGRYVPRHIVLGWLAQAGFPGDVASAAMDHLLRRGLLYSPTREDRLSTDSEVMLSVTGAYYIDWLLSNPQYVYTAIFDVPLRHERWHDAARDTFAIRIASIAEYLDAIVDVEVSHLTRLCASPNENAELLSIANHSRTLSRKVVDCALELVGRGRHARFERARETSEILNEPLLAISGRLDDLEALIAQQLRSEQLIPQGPIKKKTLGGEVGGASELQMVVPTQIGPALTNRVELSVDLGGRVELDPLLVLWQGRGEGRQNYQEMAELRRSDIEGKYKCDFVISGVKAVGAFPSSKVTVFSASRPLLVAAMGQ